MAELVLVLQLGEDDQADNSSFAEGEWNGEDEFDSSDFVLALQTGRYEPPARACDVAVAVDWPFAQDHRQARRGRDAK